MKQREIKFRAWDFKYKYMNYKILVGNQNPEDQNYTCHSMWVKPENVDYKCEPHWMGFEDGNGFKLMQFTGLYDKNGNPIYEGDFLQSPNTTYWLVEWDNEYSCFQLNSLGVKSKPIDNINCVVIGNQFENPELIK